LYFGQTECYFYLIEFSFCKAFHFSMAVEGLGVLSLVTHLKRHGILGQPACRQKGLYPRVILCGSGICKPKTIKPTIRNSKYKIKGSVSQAMQRLGLSAEKPK